MPRWGGQGKWAQGKIAGFETFRSGEIPPPPCPDWAGRLYSSCRRHSVGTRPKGREPTRPPAGFVVCVCVCVSIGES